MTLFQPKSPKKQAAKRTRVEHVVIEKRYRTKITESLNELKIMLRHTDDKKVSYFPQRVIRNHLRLKLGHRHFKTDG